MAFARERAVVVDRDRKIDEGTTAHRLAKTAGGRRQAAVAACESIEVASAIADAQALERPSGVSVRDQAEVVCELACEDSAAILSFAEELGRLAADLWFAGKLDPLPPCEDHDIDGQD